MLRSSSYAREKSLFKEYERPARHVFWRRPKHAVGEQAFVAETHSLPKTHLVIHASLWPVYWAAITMGIVVLGWNLNLAWLRWAALSGAVLATLVVAASLRQQSFPVRAIMQCLGSISLAVGISLVLGAASHDFSVDGQTYHQQAILAMINGWNPVTTPHYTGPESIWLSHYAKGAWILSASIASLWGIEAGKAIAWLFAFSAAGLSYALFSDRFRMSHRMALPCAVLFACNPVFCYQIQTYYIDGIVGSILAIAVVTGCMLVLDSSLFLTGAVASCLVIGINLKFTAGPFVIVALGVIWCWCWFARRRAAARTLFYASAAGVALAAGIGINPYLTNTLDHHHPLYPLSGPGKVDILSYNGGEAFLKHNRFYKAAVSLFSAANNVSPSNVAEIGAAAPKIPGVIKSSEIRAFYATTDLRMGGFGPWASLALVIGGAYLALTIRTQRIDILSAQGLPYAGAIGMLASALIMPELWWARYAPQLWSAFVFAVIYAFSQRQSLNMRYMGCATLAVIAINSILIFALAAGNRIVQEADFRGQIASLRQISARTPVLVHVDTESVRHRLGAEGVVFEEGATTRCRNTDNLRGSAATLCVPDASTRDYRRGAEWIARLLHHNNGIDNALSR